MPSIVGLNQVVVTRPGTTVEPGRDRVTLRGRTVRARFPEASGRAGICLALHKPPGVLTTRSDPGGGPTVYDLVDEPDRGRLVYVGRLDRETEGLLLLTDDGRLAHRLAHPRYHVDKVYVADVEGRPGNGELRRLSEGVDLEDGRTAPARVRRLGPSRLELTIHEGRKHQVKRMLEAVGHPVTRLHRTGYAGLRVDDLASGKSRELRREEVEGLRALVHRRR